MLYSHSSMRSYKFTKQFLPFIFFPPFPVERGSRERSDGEVEESTATNRGGIEIIGEHKEQIKELGEQNREQNSCMLYYQKKRNDECKSITVLYSLCKQY